MNQLKLFGAGPALPEGFKYGADILSPEEEQDLLRQVRELPVQEFQFQGYVGKRRVVSYGWQYDFNHRVLRKADDIPPFLLSLRERAAAFAKMRAPASGGTGTRPSSERLWASPSSRPAGFA